MDPPRGGQQTTKACNLREVDDLPKGIQKQLHIQRKTSLRLFLFTKLHEAVVSLRLG